MNYTLNQSVHKFLHLRQQLREIIGKSKDQMQSRITAKTTMVRQHNKQKSIGGGENKNKQNINRQQRNQFIQQTQRKFKKGQTFYKQYSTSYLEKETDLIKSKEQTLNQINELLSKKQQILSQIQTQMMKSSKISDDQVLYKCSRTMPQYFDSQKTVIKAPNLSNLRQQRKKMRKKSLI